MHHFMNLQSARPKGGKLGFSLVEIILALGVFALTIVAVLAMLGSSSQATADVLNSTTASQIADSIRSELETVGYDALVAATNANSTNPTPVYLYGTKDGRRVLLGPDPETTTSTYPVDNDAEFGDPPGIAHRDRFYLIVVEPLLGDAGFDPSAMQISMGVRIYWPHNIPLGPGTEYRGAEPSRQSIAIFNVSIPRF